MAAGRLTFRAGAETVRSRAVSSRTAEGRRRPADAQTRSGGLFGRRIEKLFIAGRDKTDLLDGLARQVESVHPSSPTYRPTSPCVALCASSEPNCPGSAPLSPEYRSSDAAAWPS